MSRTESRKDRRAILWPRADAAHWARPRQAGGGCHVELAGGRGEDHLRGRDGDPLPLRSAGLLPAGRDTGGAEGQPLALSALRQRGWFAQRVRPRPASGGHVERTILVGEVRIEP